MGNSRTCTFISFNCKSAKRSVDNIRGLCAFADIIGIQETWLLPNDIPFLSTIHEDFAYTATSAVDTSAGILRGRPHGGVALLWRKSLFPSASVVECNNNRICGIQINVGSKRVVIFSVYMPTDSAENLPIFVECVSTLHAIIEDSEVDAAYLLGDFNAHPNEPFHNELMNFCGDSQWICADQEMLGLDSGTYTYVSDSHGCERWLDHCVVTQAAWSTISKIYVMYNVYWSDHFPLVIECNLDVTHSKIYNCNVDRSKVFWGDKQPSDIIKYECKCNDLLKVIDFPTQLSECADSCCNVSSDNLHREVINKLYSDIICALSSASVLCKNDLQNRKNKHIMGWNKHVGEAHREARFRFQIWVASGKPRSGQLYDSMCVSRKVFKARLKWCQQHQDQIKLDRLASYHGKNDFRNFWKSTNRLNYRPGLSVSIENETNPVKIANLFMNYFSVKSPLSAEPRREVVGSAGSVCTTKITANQVNKAIKNMKRGKSPGHDGLSIEHLQHAGPHLPRVLAMFFSLCISHAYLPPDMIRTVVVPIVKNKTGDIAKLANYRPISLATVVAKVFDAVLDAQLDRYIQISDAQFGFRPKLSTESAILSLKHTVEYYTLRKTPIYACFLDLSKAFDLVNYELLWAKLEEAGVPMDIVHILRSWYLCQVNVVRWGKDMSEEYRLECGVRQGGRTSPKLFNLYINALIEELSSIHVGCHISGVCMNNISYADDMVLLSPSPGGLEILLKLCEKYACKHGLRYNAIKSELMVFKSGTKSPSVVPPLYLNGTPLKRVTCVKYLGHLVNENLRDDADIDRERRALAIRANMIAHRFRGCTAQVKITLFRAYCTSLYSCSLWANYSQRSISALRVQFNNAFRVLLRLPRFCSASGMFADAQVDSFSATIRKRAAATRRRVLDSSNSILSVIAGRPDSRYMQHWSNLHRSLAPYEM
ncbi:uncharacterized protein LOC134675536 [Cydia fagiglandana]|uniref:uncharacterized protein LOC134675536 n=1 Tax=Cydia fagiglandana TaxID=1458189 RepID=UPI002FEE1D96